MLSGMMMLSFIFVMMSMTIECGRRVCEVLNTKSTLTNPLNPVMEVADGSIVFKDVNFKYALDAEKFALYDIDLTIESGMTVGIIGGTGSSKTTLVNLISRLYDVTSGELLVGGVNVKDYDIETLRNEVSVVLQKNVLFSGSIAENLRWGNKEATMEEIIEASKLAQAHEFVSSFPNGYDTHIEQGGTNVSGGQKQRLCIARALLKKPKILILDDSTSAVDTKTDALIRQALRENVPHITKIIIAQRVNSIQDADKIIVLDEGKINAIGTHEELLKSNMIYQEVYSSQMKGDE
jgi:ATP-binding cassette subfamily B protein